MPALTDNLYNRGPATVDDAVREGRLSAENNFEPMSIPQAVPSPAETVAPIDWMYDEVPIPDYKTRMEESLQGLKDIKDDIINSTIPSNGTMYSQAGFINPVRSAYDPYNYDLPVSQTHTRLNSGKWISKYPTYFQGIDNEDLYARQQSAGEKFWNGIVKFIGKVGINVLGNLSMLPNKLYTGIKEGSVKAALYTDWDKILEDMNTKLDYALPHYYRKEVSDYNFWQKLTKDSGNFFWNDVLGNGAAFTVAAMTTGFITGGLGLSSLGNLGARIGLRAGTALTRRGITNLNLSGVLGRKASISNLGNLKSAINGTIRSSVKTGRFLGNAVGKPLTLGSTVGYEASVEANDFIKNSEEDFRQYYEQTYGRRPTRTEMAEFRDSVKDVASAVFGANAAILSVSNMLLFGKYIGLGNKFIPKLEQGLNKKLFGLGVKTEVKKPGEYLIKVSNQNLMQKIAAHTYNITKRPISEGLWEEGLQGVAQNAAEEYVKSRYDDVTMGRAKSFFESVRDGFQEQYTSKEGWTEIGIGAFIGSIFGIGSGFGVMENSRNRKRYEEAVNQYNASASNFNEAAVKLMKQSMSIGTQLNVDEKSMSSREFDDAIYEKLHSADEVGMLDDEVEKFKSFLDEVSDEEIAKSAGIALKDVKKYKDAMLSDFEERVDDYIDAKSFAEDLVGDENRQEYRAYIARNIYLGEQAEQRMESLADAIERVSSQQGIKDNLNTYQRLSTEMRKKARELAGLRAGIESIKSEIESLASQPRINKDGVDTAAPKIQQETERMNQLQKEYEAGIDQLNHMKNSIFDINSFRRSREEIFSNPLTMMTGEDFVRAYEQLSAFDNFLSEETENESEEKKAKKKAIEALISEYRENLLNYRNTNNFILKLNDPRSMSEDFRGFMNLLKGVVGKKYNEEQEGATPYPVEPGSIAGKTDEELDNAFKEGKITEDELFSMKAFMHSLDRLRTHEQARNNDKVTETVSDENYARFMPDESRNEDVVFSDLYNEGETMQRITDKLINIGESALSPREKDIYNANKKNFDDFIKRPKSVMDELRSLQDKAKSMDNANSPEAFNNAVIDYVRNDTEQKEELNKAIENYNKEAEKRDKKDSSYDENNLNGYIEEINRIGAESGVPGLADLVIHNYDMRSQRLGIDTRSEFGDETDMKNVTEPETPNSDKEGGVDNAQNPVVVMARRINVREDGTGGSYEVSGLQLERLISEGILKSRDGSPISAREVEGNAVEVTAGNASIILTKSGKHNRWLINSDDLAAFNENTNMTIRDVGTGFAIVLKYDAATNSYSPFYTGVGFGENEKDKIDQNALSKLKRGDKLKVYVDPNDTYNQKILEEYDKSDKGAEAEKKVKNNLVIRIETTDGKLVSVVKADFGDVSQKNRDVRQKAFELIKDSTARRRSEVKLKGSVTVRRVMPGHPNFRFDENGSIIFEGIPSGSKAMKKIAGVGYILNGKTYLKGKGGAKTDSFRTYPFTTSYMNDTKGTYKNRRIPVVAIRTESGEVYLYPVRLKSTGSSPEVDNVVKRLEDVLSSLRSGTDTFAAVNRNFVSEVNRLLTSLGAPANVFQMSYGPNSITQIENIINEMKRRAGIPNVEAWTSESADVEQIVSENVETNINLNEEPFVAPMLQVSLFTNETNDENEVEASENGVETVRRPEVPAGEEVPFGERNPVEEQSPAEGTTEHADEVNETEGADGVTTDTFEPVTTKTVSKPVDLIRRYFDGFGEYTPESIGRLSDPIGHEDSGNFYNVFYNFKTKSGEEVSIVASLNNKNGSVSYRVYNKVSANKSSKVRLGFIKRIAGWNNIWRTFNGDRKHPFELSSIGEGVSYAGFDSFRAASEFADYAYSIPFTEESLTPFNNDAKDLNYGGLFGDPEEASNWLFGKFMEAANREGSNIGVTNESGSVFVSFENNDGTSNSFKELSEIIEEFGKRYNISALQDSSVLMDPTRLEISIKNVLSALTTKAPNNKKALFDISFSNRGNITTIAVSRRTQDTPVRDNSSSRLAGKASTSEGAIESKKEC